MVAIIVNFLMMGASLYFQRSENGRGAANASMPYVWFLIDRSCRVVYKPCSQ